RDNLPEAVGLLGEHFVLAFGLRLELDEDRGGLSLGFEAAFFGLGLGFDDNLGLLGLGRCFQGRAPLRFHALGLGQRRFGEGMVLRFLNRSFGLALARLALLVGFGLLDLQLRLGDGDAGLGLVFTLDGPGVDLG